MKYLKYNLNSYNLHFIKTPKFKTISVLVNFRKPIKKEEVTIRNFLSLMLLQSTKNFPTKRLLAIETEKLYNANLIVKPLRLGNYTILSFSLMMLNDNYTEEGMYEKTLSFLFEILFNPNVTNEAFDSKSFNIVKNIYVSWLKSIKDDPRKYSLIRMLEEIDDEAPYSYRDGYLEDINKIDEKTLYEYYKDLIKSDEVDIFILGDIDVSKTKRLFKDKFRINTIKRTKEEIIVEHKKYRRRIKKIKELEDIKQAKLSIGCKLINLTEHEKKYVLPIYTSILGGPSYSKLFRNVREKHSLAYYIASIYINADNLLLISSGIDKENYEKTLELIKKAMDEMVKGDISSLELKNAKNNRISIIDSTLDNPDRIIDNYLFMELLGFDDLKTRRKQYKKVTEEDIKKVSKKIKMDTVFLLYGDEKDEEDNN